MKILFRSFLLAIGALALAGAAFAQVPSSNDTSDTNGNTGMGTGALGGPSPTDLTGSYNTASGDGALVGNTSGSRNTGSGTFVLEENTTGSANSAFGMDALQDNTTGSNNTASGIYALEDNTTGSGNTASGGSALQGNTTGVGNTASGEYALEDNQNGNDNTATGYSALVNSAGSYNTASGYEALYSNINGNYNSASGYFALHDNTTGQQNSASGVQAMYGNHTGNFNTASGTDALYSNTSGSSNIAEGYKAGYALTTGSNNIDIGNLGVAAESGTIRIGTTSTHTATYIAGISGTSVTGSAVVVSSTGQLGVTVSSERYKMAIAPMGSYTAKLTQLRPVTFHLKTDPGGALQSGLIAEEVAKVYPELVIRDEKGRIDGVRYDELAPMLLNEVQKQQQKNDAQDAEIHALKQQLTQVLAALLKIQGKSERVAQR